MKSTLGGVGLLCLLTTSSWAQSQVTLFGVMDLSLRQVSNSGVASQKSLASGGNSTSRFGVRGSEDLGGGWLAAFHLESAIAADTGVAGQAAPAGQFWDRRATVSLVNKSLGEVRLGRDFVPTYVNWGRFDPFGYVGVASASNFVSGSPVGPIRAAFGTGPNTTVRSSNALQLLLPAGLGGFEGGLMLAPSEGGTAANGQHKVVSARLGYATGPLAVSLATASSENNLTAGERFRDNAAAGSYDLGAVKLHAGWRQFKFTTSKQTNVLLAAIVPLELGQINLSWNRADLDGTVAATDVSANDATQIGLGYVYSLSKRTALYASYARVNNRGAATFTVPGGAPGSTPGGASTGYEGGVRHTF